MNDLATTIASATANKSEIGLRDLERYLTNRKFTLSGAEISNMLRNLDWVKDGHLGSGYDRQTRYVRRFAA